MNTKFKKVMSALAVGLMTIGTIGTVAACGGEAEPEQPTQPEQPAIHQHSFLEHAKVNPTCENPGYAAYLSCDGCQKYFDLDYNEIANIPEIAAYGHKLKIVEMVPATMTQGGYSRHAICENGCGKWFWNDQSSDEDNETYAEWMEIRAGLPGSWMVYEATKVIDKGPNGKDTHTMTYAEYLASSDDDEKHQLFANVLGGQAGLSFLDDGRMRQAGTFGTYTQDDESTITTVKGEETRTYKVRTDGRLECTWTNLSTTTTIILAKVDNVENIVL